MRSRAGPRTARPTWADARALGRRHGVGCCRHPGPCIAWQTCPCGSGRSGGAGQGAQKSACLSCTTPRRSAQPDERRGGWTPPSAFCSSGVVVSVRQQGWCAPWAWTGPPTHACVDAGGVRGAWGRAMDPRAPSRVASESTGAAASPLGPIRMVVPRCLAEHPAVPVPARTWRMASATPADSGSQRRADAPATRGMRGPGRAAASPTRGSKPGCLLPAALSRPTSYARHTFCCRPCSGVLKVWQDSGETREEYQCDCDACC